MENTINWKEKIINEPFRISNEQEQIVTSEEKNIRVVAGPGTGKTETLTRRILYLLICKNVEPKNIVAFTFTEKAAQSMKSRIYRRIKEFELNDLYDKLGQMFVGTIHSFCLKLLQEHYDYGNYDVLDENQEMAFIIKNGFSLGFSKEKYNEECENFFKTTNLIYDEGLNKNEQLKKNDFYTQFIKFEELLNKNKLLTFSKIIDLAVEKLENENTIDFIDYLFVDEYQDINKRQEKLIKLIGKNSNVFVVGDPRQCIYKWRGSDETYFNKFLNEFKGAKSFDLISNRRSVNEIVEVSNELNGKFEISSLDTGYPALECERKENGSALLVEFPKMKDEADWIIKQIINLKQKNNLKYSDFAILLRSVKTSATPFINAMKKQKIPFIIGGKYGLFNHDEAKTLAFIFCWFWDEGFWYMEENNKKEKLEKNKLLDAAIKLWDETVISIDEKEVKKELEKLMNEIESYKNLKQIFDKILNIFNYKKLDNQKPEHASIIANLGSFSRLLTDFESISRKVDGNIKFNNNFFKNLCYYLNNFASSSYSYQPVDDIRDIDAVNLLTIHQAKGLEWHVVFVPCLVNLRFPSEKLREYQQSWLDKIKNKFIDNETYFRYLGNNDDERKLFYVAITRPKDLLIVSYFKKYEKKSTKKSIFVNEIEGKCKKYNYKNDIKLVINKKDEVKNELVSFSISEILTYLKCPFFYQLRELWGYKPGLNEFINYGKSMHFCLHQIIKTYKNKKADLVKIVDEVVSQHFYLPYKSSREIENKAKEVVKKILKKFINENKKHIERIEETESRIDFPTEEASIDGRVDVILKENNKYELWDYKTSDEFTTFEHEKFQVLSYALSFYKQKKLVDKCRIVYLMKNDDKKIIIKEIDINGNMLRETEKKLIKYVKKMKNKNFEATPGEFCRKCDQKEICNKKKS